MELRDKQKKSKKRKGSPKAPKDPGTRPNPLQPGGPVIPFYEIGPVDPLDQGAIEAAPKVRFEATIHAGRQVSAGRIDQLDVDRIPDKKGQVRALVTADECVELLDQGFEVRLHHAHPVRPLDPALIERDESVRRLEEELRSMANSTGPKK